MTTQVLLYVLEDLNFSNFILDIQCTLLQLYKNWLDKSKLYNVGLKIFKKNSNFDIVINIHSLCIL